MMGDTAQQQTAPEVVHAISPTGEEGTVPLANAAAAEDAGYQVLSDQEYQARKLSEQEGLAGSAKAFAEHGASAATLGLSDVALGELGGDEYRRNRALRDIANPIAGTLGTATGIVAPALLSGGESLIGSAARMTPVGALARGGLAAEELAGAGLARLGLTGESALGRAALTGGKMAVSGGIEGAAYGAGQALTEAALAPGGDYDGIAQKLWAGAIDGAEFGAIGGGALGFGGSLLGTAARRVAGTFDARKMLQEAANEHTLKGVGLQGSDMQKLTAEQRQKFADLVRGEGSLGALDSLEVKAGKLTQARKDAGEVLGEMRKQIDGVATAEQLPDVAGVLRGVQARAEELAAKAGSETELKLAKKLEKEFAPLQERINNGERIGFEDLFETRQRLDERLKGAYAKLKKGDQPTLFERELMGVRSQLETEYEAAAQKVAESQGGDFAAAYKAQKDKYAALSEISKVSNKRAGTVGGNRSLSLTDNIWGAAGYAAAGPAGLLAMAANKAIRSTQADSMIGHLANKLASIDAKIENSAGAFVERSRKAAKGVVRASIGEGAAIESAPPASRKDRIKVYNKTYEAASNEAASPPGTLVHIPGAQKLQDAADNRRRMAAIYLVQQAPRPTPSIKNPVLARIARQVDPTDEEIDRWMKQVRTVENPLSAMADLKAGRLSRVQVETLKVTAPAVLEKMRAAVLEKVSDSNDDMDFNSRIQIGILLGVVTDPSLRPESIALGQKPYEARRQAMQQSAPQSSVSGRRPQGMNSRVDELETAEI